MWSERYDNDNKENTVDFKLPTDLMTGQLYTFRNLGDEIENGIAGDLGIQVVIEPHPDFKVLIKI